MAKRSKCNCYWTPIKSVLMLDTSSVVLILKKFYYCYCQENKNIYARLAHFLHPLNIAHMKYFAFINAKSSSRNSASFQFPALFKLPRWIVVIHSSIP